VIPTRPRRASAAVLSALRDRSSVKARAQTAAVGAAALVNARSQVLQSPRLFDVVADRLERSVDDLVFGVHLGPPRANRKPVLAVADRSGTLLAFVKYGVDPLTDALVAHEAQALTSLNQAAAAGLLTRVVTPRLIGTGRHEGHQFALQSPVPTATRPSQDDARLVVDAQREIAALNPQTSSHEHLVEQIKGRWTVRGASAADPAVQGFAEIATEWAATARGIPLTWGSWHGDWRATNMSVTSDGCSVWDWERFGSSVPTGYDALHLFLTRAVTRTADLSTVPHAVLTAAPRLLAPFGVSGRVEAELTAVGLLLELAGRYLDDDQVGAGGALGSVGVWLLPQLSRLMKQISLASGETTG
jgi:hypothetical protein